MQWNHYDAIQQSSALNTILQTLTVSTQCIFATTMQLQKTASTQQKHSARTKTCCSQTLKLLQESLKTALNKPRGNSCNCLKHLLRPHSSATQNSIATQMPLKTLRFTLTPLRNTLKALRNRAHSHTMHSTIAQTLIESSPHTPGNENMRK